MALPVVATRIPGCTDAVQDGVTGTLVSVRDVNGLEEAISRYLTDPMLRREHGHAGRARVLRDFQPKQIWRALHREYCSLLQIHPESIPDARDAVTDPSIAAATDPIDACMPNSARQTFARD